MTIPTELKTCKRKENGAPVKAKESKEKEEEKTREVEGKENCGQFLPRAVGEQGCAEKGGHSLSR